MCYLLAVGIERLMELLLELLIAKRNARDELLLLAAREFGHSHHLVMVARHTAPSALSESAFPVALAAADNSMAVLRSYPAQDR